MTSSDDDPWYRHRWPWFIIALLGSAIAGSLASAYLALSHPDVVLERTEELAPRPQAARPHGNG
jgi:hypothetical protein